MSTETDRAVVAEVTPRVSRRALDVAIALVLLGWGAVVMIDSRRMGMGWTFDGPAAGFFSFYIGALLSAACLGVIVRALFTKRTPEYSHILTGAHVRGLTAALIPALVLVAVMPFTGLYAAAAVYLFWFARREAKLGWLASLGLSLATGLALFAIFKLGFDVPLPTGPIELWLGY